MAGIYIYFQTFKLTEVEFAELVDNVYNFLIGKSPVDTGYFQDQWELEYSYPECWFINNTDYGEYLDDGWSKQAPNGMTEPALNYARKLVHGYY
jgi:hypothetical protein